MADFNTVDLGRVFQTGETIKAMRREGENDRIRNMYLGEQVESMRQNRGINAAQEQRTASDYERNVSAEKAKEHYLIADAVANSADPIGTIKQHAPTFIQEWEQAHGPGSFASVTPEQAKQMAVGIRDIAAAKAGIQLGGTPEQRFAASEAEKNRSTTFSNQKELADIQHKYSLEEIDRRGKYDVEKTAGSNDRRTFRDIQSLRKEFEGMDAVKNYKLVLPLYERAANAPNTRAGDTSIIYALGKMFDPTSVVREGELILAKDAAPWLQKIVANANSQITGNGALSAETRADILQALKGQVTALEGPYNQERERFSRYAQENSWNPDQVVGLSSPAAASNTGGPAVGTVEGGYRFKGGNPADPNNWEQAQ